MKFTLKGLLVILAGAVSVIVMTAYIFLNGQTGKKSKAAGGSTVALRIEPAAARLNAGDNFSYTVKARPSADINLIGYAWTVTFDKTKIRINAVEYQTGAVSPDLGQDSGSQETINQTGQIKVQGEVRTAQGVLMAQNSDLDLVTIAGKALAAGIPQLNIINLKFYQINADSTLSELAGTVSTSGCACLSIRKCSDACVDADGVSIGGFNCYNDNNCSVAYARTRGDATGDGKACLDDYNELIDAWYGRFKDLHEKRLHSDFNGQGAAGQEIDNGDLERFKQGFNADLDQCGKL